MRSEENKRGTATVSEKFWGKCTVQGVPGLDPSTNTSPNPVAQVPPLLTKDRAQTNKRQTFIARRGRTARASGALGPWSWAWGQFPHFAHGLMVARASGPGRSGLGRLGPRASGLGRLGPRASGASASGLGRLGLGRLGLGP